MLVAGRYYELWKKYGLPWPHRNIAHPERRMMGVDHGFYDDVLLLNERPDYAPEVDRVLQEGLRAMPTCWA